MYSYVTAQVRIRDVWPRDQLVSEIEESRNGLRDTRYLGRWRGGGLGGWLSLLGLWLGGLLGLLLGWCWLGLAAVG